MASSIYFDHAATTPCDPRVRAVLLDVLDHENGNPHSTTHEAGMRAADRVAHARNQVASLIEADAKEIIFTSGATEANNLAIKGAVRHLAAQGSPRKRVITVATEHKCVLESVRDLAQEGFEPVVLPVDVNGLLHPSVLQEALKVPTALVSIMAANNETGVLQDMPVLSRLVNEAGALLHSDLAQAAGKIPVDVHAWDLALASVSSHKLYGPKGAGALFVRRRPRVRLAPLFSGGGQERGVRSGTVPGFLVAAFGEACQIAKQELDTGFEHLSMLQRVFLNRLDAALPGCEVNAAAAPRLPGIFNLRLPAGVSALDVVAVMPDLAVSLGSACSSAELAPSYVLEAMGLSREEAGRSLRLSPGRFTSAAEAERAADNLAQAVLRVRSVT
ncbi:cysteine desulfurase II NifS [Acetobacter pasteurianus NBRC 3280]|uniref:Cysteine desulfurase n=1 Tax=Acetobacter pasteurianus NBRC 3278 TaxID=1226660 RepID=A0A401X680_ACEPA|nr:cysteine desulfurase family protein [Acetobacter pasteurianus]GCD59823.1 cysteine desulfurase II NifS [Acetobacter pasteurianus NBRC 3277]GCD63334.1 cysteine desulfurase II NifS [Acetobacter pasteurianus NBRC 3278]GCD69704.1 cysteine desulfurase II NifS [Acetobacter pasteurianus NBRC 3280]